MAAIRSGYPSGVRAEVAATGLGDPATLPGPDRSRQPSDRSSAVEEGDAVSDSVAEGDQPSEDVELSKTVAALTDEDLDRTTRSRLLGRLVRAEVRERGVKDVKDLLRPKAAVRWVIDAVTEAAPHIPIRNLETLRRHHDGLDGEALADRLVRNAARATAGIGAAGGGVAAVEWVAAPTLVSGPALLAAGTGRAGAGA